MLFLSLALTLNGQTLPDFSVQISNLRLEQPQTGFPRDPYKATFRVSRTIAATNLNPTDARQFELKVYISTDNVLSADDLAVSYQNLMQNTFNVNLSTEFLLSALPKRTGVNYILMKIDDTNAIAEANETNNVSNALPLDMYFLTCRSNSLAPWSEWISNVKLNTLNNCQVIESNENNNMIVSATPFTIVSATGCANDITPPVFQNCPANITQAISGQRSFITWANSTATDDCTAQPFVFSNIFPPFSFEIGTTQVVYTADDAKGNRSFCRFNVTLTQNPTTILPDLTLSNAQMLNTRVKAGDSLFYSVTASNTTFGSTPATTIFFMSAYFSTDNVLSADDIPANPSSIFGEVIGKQSYDLNGAYTFIPNTLAAGDYYLILKIDNANVIAESNENNNVVVATTNSNITKFTVLPPTGATCANNLLTNGGFENGLTGWNGGGQIVASTNTGTGAIKFCTDQQRIYQSIPAQAGKTYSMRVFGKTDDASGNTNGTIGIKFLSSSFVPLLDRGLISFNATTYVNYLTPSYDVTAPTGTAYVEVYVSKTTGTGCVFVDDWCLTTTTTTCNNITNGGEISGNENQCQPFSSAAPGNGYFGTTIKNTTSPTGGTGALEYVWRSSNTQIPTSITEGSLVTGATKDSLDVFNPNAFNVRFINTSTYYRRFVRRAGCTAYVPSATGVSKILNIQSPGTLVCPTDTTVNILATETCYSGPLKSFTRISTGCDLPTLNVSEQRTPSCLPVGVNQVGWTLNGQVCTYKVTVVKQTTSTADIAVSLASTPSVFSNFSTLVMAISAKNVGTQTMTNVKIEFQYPAGTVSGGTAVPSLGTWNEWCAGGIQCFTWTIPSLAANATATLNLPLYILSPTSPIIAVAKLLSSTPVDGNAANNTATLTINKVTSPIQPLIAQRPTQLVPIVFQKIAPKSCCR